MDLFQESNPIKDVTNLMTESESMDYGHDEDDDDEDDMLKAYNVSSNTPNKGKRQLTPDGANCRRKKMMGDAENAFSPSIYKAEATPNSRKYQTRANSGGIVTSFGEGLAGDWKSHQADFSATIKCHDQELKKSYRFMYESLGDKAGYLDEIICRIGDVLVEKNNLQEAVQDFVQTLPDTFVSVGRICCDSPEGRLNAHSVVLQGHQDISGGATLPMDVSRVGQFSLFPGQIVAAETVNPNGSRLLASKILSDASPELPKVKDRITNLPLSVAVVSGPYTTSDNLGYEPLKDLLKYIVRHRPHVVILVGPFVDSKHGIIDKGEYDEEPFEKLFERLMSSIYEAAQDTPSTQFVLVSSSRDVHHNFIYPTPPYVSTPNKPANVHMVSDPVMLNIEGVIFGVTSTDILFHLGKEEIFHPPRSEDRLRRLASHILHQRSFYPLYPPNEDVNVDYEHLEKHSQLNVQPHVLILPSDLLHFFKDINGCLVMNPSRLTKREGGGVFARMLINPAKSEDQPFAKRVQAEIVRI